jgi:5'-nucleotidase
MRTLPFPSLSALLLSGALLVSCAHGGSQPTPTPAPTAVPQRQVRVRLLALNDFHGHLAPPPGSSGEVRSGSGKVQAGGVGYLARHLATLRARAPQHTLVVAAGDLIGATPLVSALFHDEPTIEALSLAGLDISSVGNHEFDEGTAELQRMQAGGCHPVDGCQDGTPFAGARFQYLSANVLTEQGKPLFPAYTLREFEGVKVAFIGMTLEGTPEIVDGSGIRGLRFQDEVETVNALVPELKRQGAEAIVVLLHEGGNQSGTYDGCEGISGPIVAIHKGLDKAVDVLITGHTHQAYNCVLDGRRVTSAMSYGRLVTDMELVLDGATGDVVETSAHNLPVTRDVEVVPEVQALVERYEALAAPLRDRVIGRVTARLQPPNGRQFPSGESPLGNVIADAQLAATKDAGAQVAFINPGGIRGELDAGDVTYGEAFTVQPFGNALVTMTLTGAQLHTLLELQWQEDGATRVFAPSRGFSYTWKASAPVGQKVDPASIRLGGKPVEPQGRYRVTVNSFLASGSDGFRVLAEGTNRRGGLVDVDALEAWLKNNSPLNPPETNRITRVD